MELPLSLLPAALVLLAASRTRSTADPLCILHSPERGRARARSAATGVLVVAVAWGAAPPESAASGDDARCGRAIASGSQSPTDYKKRGDRCEGVFRKRVSASARPRLRGFHIYVPRFRVGGPEAPRALTTHVLGDGERAESGRLVVRSVKPKHYYQMDTDRVGPGQTYEWDQGVLVDVARKARLDARDLAAMYCQNDCDFVPGVDIKVWPVYIEDPSEEPPLMRPHVVLQTETDLTSLRVGLEPVGGGEPVRESKPLPGHYPKGQSIIVPLEVPAPGQYRLNLETIDSEGGGGLLEAILVFPDLSVGAP